MAIKKYIKKTAKKVFRAVKKRYTTQTGGLRIKQVVKDVAMLKSLVNVEKKSIQTIELGDFTVAQCDGNNSGSIFSYICPEISQGNGYNQRSGNEVKLVSMCIKGQVKQQTFQRHPTRLKITVFKIIGQVPAISSLVTYDTKFYELNPLNTLVDFNSSRNVDYFKNFRVLSTKYVTIPAEATSGEQMIKDFSIIMKLNHHVKWDKDTTTISNGQIVMCITADSGNKSTTVTSTLNVPITAVSTGNIINYYTKFYYVDN